VGTGEPLGKIRPRKKEEKEVKVEKPKREPKIRKFKVHQESLWTCSGGKPQLPTNERLELDPKPVECQSRPEERGS
jgi:hypothetical protein